MIPGACSWWYLECQFTNGCVRITALQHDRKIVSTDPPYYDNIGYADLVGLLLRLAASIVAICVSGSLRHFGRAQD